MSLEALIPVVQSGSTAHCVQTFVFGLQTWNPGLVQSVSNMHDFEHVPFAWQTNDGGQEFEV
jgi:hypothetical protein